MTRMSHCSPCFLSRRLMNFAPPVRRLLSAALLTLVATSAWAQGGAPAAPAQRRSGQTVRVVGVVRDEANAISLPGIPVEVVATKEIVYTDVDGKYVLDLP